MPNTHHLHSQSHTLSSTSSTSSYSPLMDAVLYCDEEEALWDEDDELLNQTSSGLFPILLLEQDLFWEDEELLTLFSKQQQTHLNFHSSSLSLSRTEAVEWMLKVNSYYGFSTLTAILSINYLDRFLCKTPPHPYQPWLIQLAAVTCLSLAAKVEETDVPLLLDLQVEGAKYVFESRAIQKMELVVLSTLEWKMNPVTPVSFLDHIIRRLGLKSHLHWEFLRRCEQLLLSIVADSRLVGYKASVLATAAMMHVIEQMETSNPCCIHYHNQLLALLNIDKEEEEEVRHCYELTVAAAAAASGLKRKRQEDSDYCYSGDGSSTSSSPARLINKKRVYEQYMPLRLHYLHALDC